MANTGPETVFTAKECQALLDLLDKLIPYDLAIGARTIPFDRLRESLKALMTEEEIEAYGKLLEGGKYF